MVETLERTTSGRMPYFAALDGVRAWCILLVIYNHLKSDGHLPGWINGHLGVDVFFILSGFLITTLLTREQVFTGRIDLPAFYWRRFFRIAPVYLVVILMYVAVTHLHGQHEKWVEFRGGLPWFLTMMNEYAREPNNGTVFTHSWSLGVEEKFYLVWPVLGFVLVRVRARLWLIAGLFAVLAVPPLLGYTYLARAYCGLVMGCLLAVVLSGPGAARASAAMRRTPAVLVLALLVLGFYLEHLSKGLFVFFSLFAAVFLGHLILVPSWLAGVHELAAVRWLGRRSYAMYLVHILCLNVVEAHLRASSAMRALVMFVVAVGLSAGVAEVLFRLVEAPARRAGRAWLARRGEVARAV